MTADPEWVQRSEGAPGSLDSGQLLQGPAAKAQALARACGVFNTFPTGELFRRLGQARHASSGESAQQASSPVDRVSGDAAAARPLSAAVSPASLLPCLAMAQNAASLRPAAPALSRVPEQGPPSPHSGSDEGDADVSTGCLLGTAAHLSTPAALPAPQHHVARSHGPPSLADGDNDSCSALAYSSSDSEEAQQSTGGSDESSSAGSTPLARDMTAWRAQKVTDDGGIQLQFLFDEPGGGAQLDLVRHVMAAQSGDPGVAGTPLSSRSASSRTLSLGHMPEGEEADSSDETYREDAACGISGRDTLPIRITSHGSAPLQPLAICLMVVGTRGDVQPFIGIALQLRRHGHRVRLASHAIYRDFVESFGLEFYPLGGDPKVLSEFVVKHRGVNPGFDLKDVRAQRQQVRDIVNSTYLAATEADPQHPDQPFTADALVCNPPSYGHIHVAEKLRVPLHMVFTMPWTPTLAFPQPFARLVGTSTQQQRKHSSFTQTMNWLSYFAMDDLAWMGLSDIIKNFRCKVLGLQGWGTSNTSSHALYYNRVPFTYIWSPSLVPRPADWRSHCDVAGFVHLDLATLTQYAPPPELAAFLAEGEPPIYIGFGSLVMNNPDQLTHYIIQAVAATGVRAIIQKGWGGLGSGLEVEGRLLPRILLVDTCAHDWLFPRCAALVHHGGAGTTATGLYAGKPTFIVPFFGDQPFWGWACHEAGVGPPPVAVDRLSAAKITEAIQVLMRPEMREAAVAMALRMHQEEGAVAAVRHIHRSVYGARQWERPPLYWAAVAGAATSPAAAADAALLQQCESASQLLGRMRLPHHTRRHARRQRKEDQAKKRRRSSAGAARSSCSGSFTERSPDSTYLSSAALEELACSTEDPTTSRTRCSSCTSPQRLTAVALFRAARSSLDAVPPPPAAVPPLLIKGSMLRRLLAPLFAYTLPLPPLLLRWRLQPDSGSAHLLQPCPPPTPARSAALADAAAAHPTAPAANAAAAAPDGLISSVASSGAAAVSAAARSVSAVGASVVRGLQGGTLSLGHSLSGATWGSARALRYLVGVSPIGWLGRRLPIAYYGGASSAPAGDGSVDGLEQAARAYSGGDGAAGEGTGAAERAGDAGGLMSEAEGGGEGGGGQECGSCQSQAEAVPCGEGGGCT